jgi:hypothetical protein
MGETRIALSSISHKVSKWHLRWRRIPAFFLLSLRCVQTWKTMMYSQYLANKLYTPLPTTNTTTA